ncbi:hypothetical protein ACVWZZ_007515 [Bradyrhizobium sp. LM6.10]
MAITGARQTRRRHAGADDIAEVLKRQNGVGPGGSDMAAERPQQLQQCQRMSRPVRCAIDRIRRLIERIRLAEEKQIGDPVAPRGQPGAKQSRDLLRTGVLGLGLYEKHVQLSSAALGRRECCRSRLAQLLIWLVMEHGSGSIDETKCSPS